MGQGERLVTVEGSRWLTGGGVGRLSRRAKGQRRGRLRGAGGVERRETMIVYLNVFELQLWSLSLAFPNLYILLHIYKISGSKSNRYRYSEYFCI